MLSVLLFLLILSSGSVLAAVVWKKRFEETFVITATLAVLLLFLSGVLFGSLLAGAVLVCLLAAAAYAAAFALLPRRRAGTAAALFTPAFVAYVLVLGAALYLCYGKLAASWDEFSHWMDIVKVMALYDDFGTNPLAGSSFASYPPGMALFQYLLQKLYRWTTGQPFSEWHAYFAYLLLCPAFLLPFLKEWKSYRLLPLLAVVLRLVLCPILSFGDQYYSVLIEPYLGFLFGAGFAAVFVHRRGDLCSFLHICCACSMLVLAKDAGLLLAVFVVLGYLLVLLLEQRDAFWRAGRRGRAPLAAALVCLSAALPYALWNLELETSGAGRAFAQPYDAGVLLRVFLGQDDTWRGAAWRNYFTAFATRPVRMRCSYLVFGIFFLVAAAVGAVLLWRRCALPGKRAAALCGLLAVQYVVYVVGLAATYITRLGESNALGLASFDRYLHIEYFGLEFALTALVFYALPRLRGLAVAALLAMTVVTVGLNRLTVRSFFLREHVTTAAALRGAYTEMADALRTGTPADARVWFISQEDSGLDHWIIHFEARPRLVSGQWSLGGPFYAGDAWSAPLAADDWQRQLREGYDYVALYALNDAFAQQYAGLFADPAQIREGAVYRVDRQTGLLALCTAGGTAAAGG